MLELVDGKKHIVIKRDGREEPFSWNKLNKVIDWAITYKTGIDESRKEFFRNEIIKNMKLRIHNKIKIEKLFDNLIDVTASLADRMYPEFDKIARNLFIQKWYKETWGMKRDEYPNYEEVIKKGIGYGIYDPEIFNSFNAQEIQELNKMIKNERDFEIASFLGITLMHNKYSLNYTKNKKLELPQHTFMRIAVNSFFIEKENRLQYIEKMYNFLSKHYFTRATPYYLNAGTLFRMLASCVLTQMNDDSNSINKTIHNLGIYSRHGGGTACDVSKIRSIDSVVAKTGKSSGKISFIKMIESAITAYNQKGCVSRYNYVKRLKKIIINDKEYTPEDIEKEFGKEALDFILQEYVHEKINSSKKGSISKSNSFKQEHSLYALKNVNKISAIAQGKLTHEELYKKRIENSVYEKNKTKNIDTSNVYKKLKEEKSKIYEYKKQEMKKYKTLVTKEYLINNLNYTEQEAKEFYNNTSKEAFIKKYGYEQGLQKYKEFREKCKLNFRGFSKEANKFIEEKIIPFLKEKYNAKLFLYAGNGKEFYLKKSKNAIYKYDLYVPELNLLIDYHGTSFHPKENQTDWKSPYGETYEEVIIRDRNRKILAYENKFNYVVIYSDEKDNYKEIIEGALNGKRI